MPDSSGAQQRPRSLKVFLDAGGDLTAPDIWEERLAEVVYLDLPLAPPGERARRAADARAKALKTEPVDAVGDVAIANYSARGSATGTG